MPMGNAPHRVIFHVLLIVTGTTYAEGEYLHRIFSPFSANGLGVPVLLLVPSGNITAERLVVSMYSASFRISESACFPSFRSISTDPPCRKL